jgi:hypothetical protein
MEADALVGIAVIIHILFTSRKAEAERTDAAARIAVRCLA